MATLNGGISSTSELIRVSGTPPAPGTYFTIDSEALKVNGATRGAQGRNFTRDYLAVDRGVAGTTKATHADGATLTPYYPDAPGGLRVIGPFSVTYNDPDIALYGAVLCGDPLPANSVVLRCWPVINQAWTNAGAFQIGLYDNLTDFNYLPLTNVDATHSVADDGGNADIWTEAVAGDWPGFPGDQTLRVYIGHVGPNGAYLVAFGPSPGGPTTGQADVYALIGTIA